MVNKDWYSIAMQNEGLLPPEFANSEDVNNADLALDLVLNGKKENINFFSTKTQIQVLGLEPYLLPKLKANSEREYTEKDIKDIVIKSPSLIRYAEDKIVKEALEEKPELLRFASARFCEENHQVVVEAFRKYPDTLLRGSNIDNNNPDIVMLTKGYISGELPLPERSELTPENSHRLYANAGLDIKSDVGFSRKFLSEHPEYYQSSSGAVKDDINIAKDVISKLPQNVMYIGKKLRENEELMALYIKHQPKKFATEGNILFNTTDETVLSAVLKEDIHNFRLLKDKAMKTPIMQDFQSGLEKLHEIRPFDEENPNFKFELVSNKQIMSMDADVLNSIMDFDSKAVDVVINAAHKGEIEGLKKHINISKGVTKGDARSIHSAITTYDSVSELIKTIPNGELSEENKSAFKHILETQNAAEIKNFSELSDYCAVVKNKCLNAQDLEQTQNNIQTLFGISSDKLSEINKKFPETAMAHPSISFLEEALSVKNKEDLTTLINNKDFNLILKSSKSIEDDLKSEYSSQYQEKLIDLSKLTTIKTIDGAKVSELDGQDFDMFIHRVFNFDRSLSNKASALIEDPNNWKTMEGASYISTSFINEKSIKGVFRPLKKENEADLTMLPEFTKEFLMEEKEKHLKEKHELKEIDKDAVFLGFTKLPDNSIISMDSCDMMTEHGGRKAEIRSHVSQFYSPDDLAYCTTSSWNEVSIERQNPETKERMMPTCIVCFDGNINKNSVNFAKTLDIPIVNIDRQAYAEKNTFELEKNKTEFNEKLSPNALKEVFYRTPPEEMLDTGISQVCKTITDNDRATLARKKECLDFLDDHVERFFTEKTIRPARYYTDEQLEKMLGTYKSDTDKIKDAKDLLVQTRQSLVINKLNNMQNIFSGTTGANNETPLSHIEQTIVSDKISPIKKQRDY